MRGGNNFMKKLYSVDNAISLLKEGAVIAYPTETFYGIGCSAFDIEAVRKIYCIKERAITQALPLLVRNFEQAQEIADIEEGILASLEEITSSFWPGSLSILVPAKDCISSLVTAGTGKIVVRQSPHEVASEIVEKLNAPLISTSANKSGESPARLLSELDEALEVDAVLACGAEPKGGLPSTIIEVLPEKKIKILRSGAFNIMLLKEYGYEIDV